MKWFKHDSDANMDAKLQEVLLDYGLEGYGLYWYCLELITQKVTSDNITFSLEHDARIIARNTGASVQKVETLMLHFIKVGLFENSDGIITCLKLAKRLDKSMTNSPVMRQFIDEIRDRHGDVMTLPDSVSECQPRIEEEKEEEGDKEGDKNSKKQSNKISVECQIVIDGYNEIINKRKPNWIKCQAINEQRKKMIVAALKICKQKSEAKGYEKPSQYLLVLLDAMSRDLDFFSGHPNARSQDGFRCSFETNFRQQRIMQAIDRFAGDK